MSVPSNIDAFSNQFTEIYLGHMACCALVAGLSRLEHLLHGSQQPVRVAQHQLVKVGSLLGINFAALESF